MAALQRRATCPWAYSPGMDIPFGLPHNHLYHYPYSYEMQAPRWAFNRGPCCEFCSTIENIPSLDEALIQLQFFMPQEVEDLLEAIEGIHHHYQWSFDRDGPESYYLAREVQKLAKYLRRMYHFCPWMPQLGTLSDQLKYMGRDAQVGPRRLRYHTMPKQRYRPRTLMFDPWDD